MDAAWTITELAEHAATALASGTPVQLNGRIRDLPNTRLIRWYTTIGLLDPPLGRRGRTALYGHRHLLQLVAVKRRQSEGHSIADIQLELTGATDTQLSRIAALPTPPEADEPPPTSGDRTRFWTARPDVSSPSDLDVTITRGGLRPKPPEHGQIGLVQGIRLGYGVTVMLEQPVTTPLTEEDLAAISTAALPLMNELRRLGLVIDHAFPHPSGMTTDPSGRSK